MTRRQLATRLTAASLSAFTAKGFAGQALAVSAECLFYDPMHFGARGDGVTKDTQALQRTIDSCAHAGGGRVVLSPGHTFLSGTLVLQAHVELHLMGGSTLQASPDREDYHSYGSLLFAKDATDIHVSGTGTIDGNFEVFFGPKGPQGYTVPQPFLGPYDPLYPESQRNPPDGRPRMILFVNCRRVLLEQFTIRRSPTWTIHPIGCDDLQIRGLSILNDLEVPNCDGIDIDHCRNVRVSDCHIVAGDDCLILKASRNFGQYGPCEAVTITNCTLESSSAAIKVEPEGPFPVRSVLVSGCSIVRSNREMSVLNRDGAAVEDLQFTDMVIETRMRPLTWWGSGEPLAVSSAPRAAGGPAGLVRNIVFENLQCRGESGIYLRGTKAAPLKNIQLRDIGLIIEKTTTIPGGFYDMRPGELFGADGLDRRQTAALFAADVDGLGLHNVRASWGGANIPAYYGAAVALQRCHDVLLRDVVGDAAHLGQPATSFEEVTFAKALGELTR